MTLEPSTPGPDAKAQHTGASAPRTVSSGALLEGGRELMIRHGDETYRLRLTANDKLILTK